MQHQYLFRLEYLGFRYSGWQKQPGQKTVEGMVHKTFKYILGQRKFRILASGRTDAKVSATAAAVSLYLEEPLDQEYDTFLQLLNENLPPDLRATKFNEVPITFNVIKDCEWKEYTYLFASGKKLHPYCAPFMVGILEELDIALMMKVASLFEGTHDFRAYTVKQSGEKNTMRTVERCEIILNEELKASFFPETSYFLRIRASGFIRYQVRMIMGALIELGKGRITLLEIEDSLRNNNDTQWTYVAPGSGLLLNHVEFK